MNWNTLKRLSSLDWSVWSLWIWAGLLGLGQLQRWQITPTVALYFHEVLMMALIVIWGWHDRRRIHFSLKKVRPQNWSWALKIVVLTAVLSQVLGIWKTGNASSLLYLARWSMYAAWLWLALPKTELFGPLKAWWAMLPILLTAWFGWWQYLLLPDVRWLYILGWDNHYWRLVSTQLDPGYAGVLLVLGWTAMQQKWWQLELGRLHGAYAWPVWAAAALTFSRATWLIAALSLVWLARRQPQRWRLWAASALVFLSCIWLAPKPGGEGVNITRTSTLDARWQHSKQFLQQLSPWQLVVGNGWYTFSDWDQVNEYPNHAHLPDAWPIALLYSWGAVGTATALWLLQHFSQQQRHTSPQFIIYLIILGVFGLFNNLLQPFLLLSFFWLSATSHDT